MDRNTRNSCRQSRLQKLTIHKGHYMTEPWYIVVCNPNSERKAAAEIRRRGFGVHVPRNAVVKRHHRTKKPIMKRRPLLECASGILTHIAFGAYRSTEN